MKYKSSWSELLQWKVTLNIFCIIHKKHLHQSLFILFVVFLQAGDLEVN